MIRVTAFSLPGMARDEKITRSPRRERDQRMLVLGDARQRRARLALAAGAERHDLVGRQVAVGIERAEFADVVEIAGLARDLRDALHGAPDQHDLAAAGGRRLGHGADARDVGGEGGDADAARRAADQLAPAPWRRRLPTASGLRARRWWSRRAAPGSPRRRARAASPRRSAGRSPGSDRSSSRRCAAPCRAACG